MAHAATGLVPYDFQMLPKVNPKGTNKLADYLWQIAQDNSYD